MLSNAIRKALRDREAEFEKLVRYVRDYTAWARQKIGGVYATDDPPFAVNVLNSYAALSAETRKAIEEEQ